MTEENPAYRGRTKYDERTARRYQVRKEGKNRAEMRLISRAFALVPKSHRVLDVPCGGGRVTIHLSGLGYSMSAADLSESMIAIARENIAEAGLNASVERQDVEKFTYHDREFDSVISFRLFHHFPTPLIRQTVVRQLCRVARKYVVLSYFSPRSFTSVKRSLRVAMGGRRSEKHTTPLSEVQSYFAASGFQLVKDFAQLAFVHTLHLGVFERIGESAP